MSDNEDDLYADLYGGAEQTEPEESGSAAPSAAPAASSALDDPPEPSKAGSDSQSGSGAGYQPPTRTIATWEDGQIQQPSREDSNSARGSARPDSNSWGASRSQDRPANLPPPGTRADVPQAARFDDGKMFIGGLNWDTTDEGLSNYFSQFGKVISCTVMRDPNSGRSRGFAFLTFEDPSAVNDVMIREHFLDGKAIDPKRAIPRSEEKTTDKLFVRNIPPGVTQPMLLDYFGKFGMLTDCTLMMDRDTRQHRGFGFVTFKDEATVERVVNGQPYEIFGQQIEVKRSAPRRGEEGGRGGFRGGRGGGHNSYGGHQSYGQQGGNSGGGNNMMMGGGMNMGGMPGMMMPGFDPNAMAEYFKNMGWGQWNPAMMMMNPMMMGQMGSGGMMMPGMQASAAGSPQPMAQSGGSSNGRGSEPKSLSPPPNAPTGPKAGSASGPVRHNTGGRGYHPYSR